MSFRSCSLPFVCPATLTGILPNARVAPLAQWIEHLSSKQRVGGSNPSRGTFLWALSCRHSVIEARMVESWSSGDSDQRDRDQREHRTQCLDCAQPLVDEQARAEN